MARVGAFGLSVLFLSLIIVGCDEKATSVQETGLMLSFSNCNTFTAYVWIDDVLLPDEYSTEQPSLIEIASGSHKIFVRGNIVIGDSSYCWTENFSVSEGAITPLALDCIGAKCEQ